MDESEEVERPRPVGRGDREAFLPRSWSLPLRGGGETSRSFRGGDLDLSHPRRRGGDSERSRPRRGDSERSRPRRGGDSERSRERWGSMGGGDRLDGGVTDPECR